MHQPRDIVSKILSRDQLRQRIVALKGDGKRVVFTNGCFDIVHAGHVNLLQDARRQGDVLVVAVNSDASVRGLKGPTRPVVAQQQRAQVVASLEAVDYVVVFDELDPLKVIEALVPHVLVKGGDWSPETIVGRDVVERNGGCVMALPLVAGLSTTEIIRRVTAAG
ncbi:MAG: D-glycero-beta-D-manno-heptose 1-phosphate adenylyltransferase [Deltaproteobacteria bacterium]|nr:D-glycero-beta-D-manno-heptose 1-phosphate adenylyltransferase [Deltaproteobacteria bacterium]